MEKPKLWKYKSGAKKGKLRPAAKEYLSQRVKEYFRAQKERFIRVWAKLKYTKKDSPQHALILEAYIEGEEKDGENLQFSLMEFIASNYNAAIMNACEYGFERIETVFDELPTIKYKRADNGEWRYLK